METGKDSRVIANEFLRLAGEAHDKLTPMQLLKLVYIAHGWMLALYEEPLVCDDVEAWTYGPVIPRLYEEIRHYRGAPILDKLPQPQQTLSDEEKDIIRQTYERYGKLTGLQLSQMTHQKGTPWSQTYKNYTDFGKPILSDVIQTYYRQQLSHA